MKAVALRYGAQLHDLTYQDYKFDLQAGNFEADHFAWIFNNSMRITDLFKKQEQTTNCINYQEYRKQPTKAELWLIAQG